MAIWEDLLNERDKAIIEKSGWGKRWGAGERPAILVIDAQYMFVGPKTDLGTLETTFGIGASAWKAIEHIGILLGEARKASVPIVYLQQFREPLERRHNPFLKKKFRGYPSGVGDHAPTDIVEEIAPQENDTVIKKKFASPFIGTPIVSYLNDMKIDTLIVTGFVTSGCVRATVVDAASHNYSTIVVEEAVADILDLTHKVNLLDMDLKYADVTPLEKVVEYMQGLKQG